MIGLRFNGIKNNLHILCPVFFLFASNVFFFGGGEIVFSYNPSHSPKVETG